MRGSSARLHPRHEQHRPRSDRNPVGDDLPTVWLHRSPWKRSRHRRGTSLLRRWIVHHSVFGLRPRFHGLCRHLGHSEVPKALRRRSGRLAVTTLGALAVATLHRADARVTSPMSCEEYAPAELVAQARAAEQAGFHALWISDHYHPWNHEQGQSAFVWSVIGALAGAGVGLPVTTAVTCPTVRIHPAVDRPGRRHLPVLLDGRFTLGVGTGEALNEHILGDRWPEADVRLEMLEEAVEVMRALWSGDRSATGGLTTPSRTRASSRCPMSPRRSSSPASGRRRSTWRRASATASSPRPRTRTPSTASAKARRQACAGGRQGLLRAHRGGGRPDGAPHLAERPPARRARPDPADARALRTGLRAGHRGGRQRGCAAARDPTSTSTSHRSRSTRRPVSTSCSFSRSAADTMPFSRPTPRTSCRVSTDRSAVQPAGGFQLRHQPIRR